MKKILPFVLFWIVNSLFIYLATLVYPAKFVLGNFRFSPLMATIWAGLWITVIVWLAVWIVGKLKIKLSGSLTMFLFYWLADALAVWITAHLAQITGFGIASFLYAIALGLVLDIVQYLVMKLGKFAM